MCGARETVHLAGITRGGGPTLDGNERRAYVASNRFAESIRSRAQLPDQQPDVDRQPGIAKQDDRGVESVRTSVRLTIGTCQRCVVPVKQFTWRGSREAAGRPLTETRGVRMLPPTDSRNRFAAERNYLISNPMSTGSPALPSKMTAGSNRFARA